MNNLWRGFPEALDPMQLLRMHRIKAGSAFTKWKQFTWKRNGSNHDFHLDTKTSSLLIANRFHQNILSTKCIKMNHLPTVWWLLTNRFCGSLWTFCDCGVTITMLCNYYHECAAWIGWGLFNAVCQRWANSGPRAKCGPQKHSGKSSNM